MNPMDTTLDTTLLAPRSKVLLWMLDAEAARASADLLTSARLAERVIAWSRRARDDELMGRALLVRAASRYLQNKLLDAALDAQEAVRLCRACGLPAHEASALRLSAIVADSCGDVDRAIALGRAALACLPPQQDVDHGRERILLTLALMLQQDEGEFVEATLCATEAVALAARTAAQSPVDYIGARARLAWIRVKHADALIAAGQPDQAQQVMRAAAECVPSLAELEAARPPALETQTLDWMLPVLARLGRHHEARRGAARALRAVHHSPNLLLRANIFESVAQMYGAMDLPSWSLRHELRLLSHFGAIGNTKELARCQLRVANLHARQGRYQEALDMLRVHQQQHHRHDLTERLLRCRVAAVQRQAERRRLQAQEANAHGARLAVIGRLIAQTHHALSAPLSRAHQRLAGPPGNPQALHQRMVEVNQCIDRAAALVSQLKLFSFRAAPQPMSLSLHEALCTAPQGLGVPVVVVGLPAGSADDTRHAAWADAQRLGILLKVLLIELAGLCGGLPAGSAAPVLVEPALAVSATGRVTLTLEVPAHVEANAAERHTLGLTLCTEIAEEMNGSLSMQALPGRLLFKLTLPAAPSPPVDLYLDLPSVA
jgi:tetratricopeptide (TPR) repeat protein